MEQQWQPTEEQIEKLLKERSPRELAIGYLRAVKRAEATEKAFFVLEALNNAEMALKEGDSISAVGSLREVKHIMAGRKV